MVIVDGSWVLASTGITFATDGNQTKLSPDLAELEIVLLSKSTDLLSEKGPSVYAHRLPCAVQSGSILQAMKVELTSAASREVEDSSQMLRVILKLFETCFASGHRVFDATNPSPMLPASWTKSCHEIGLHHSIGEPTKCHTKSHIEPNFIQPLLCQAV